MSKTRIPTFPFLIRLSRFLVSMSKNFLPWNQIGLNRFKQKIKSYYKRANIELKGRSRRFWSESENLEYQWGIYNPQKIPAAVTGCPENHLFPVGKPPKRPTSTRFPLQYFGIFSKKVDRFGGLLASSDRGRIFFADYGYPMGTLNSQIHFKIGDSSL